MKCATKTIESVYSLIFVLLWQNFVANWIREEYSVYWMHLQTKKGNEFVLTIHCHSIQYLRCRPNVMASEHDANNRAPIPVKRTANVHGKRIVRLIGPIDWFSIFDALQNLLSEYFVAQGRRQHDSFVHSGIFQRTFQIILTISMMRLSKTLSTSISVSGSAVRTGHYHFLLFGCFIMIIYVDVK